MDKISIRGLEVFLQITVFSKKKTYSDKNLS